MNNFWVFCLIFSLLNTYVHQIPTIYLVGDSTVSSYSTTRYPQMGWGQVLGRFFLKEEAKVVNKAVSGKSTKSYIENGSWDRLLNQLKEGDYVFIQFGHNDMKEGNSELYAAPFGAYTDNLVKMVLDVRRIKANPILVTPVYRRRFDQNDLLEDSMGWYPVAVRKICMSINVPLIDLHKKSYHLFSDLGRERSKDFFLWLPPNRWGNYPEGIKDNTHFQEDGAIALSKIIVESLTSMKHPLAKAIKKNNCKKP